VQPGPLCSGILGTGYLPSVCRASRSAVVYRNHKIIVHSWPKKVGQISEERAVKRVALYLRVSTGAQTTENQERELRAVAARAGWDIVHVYRDAGISGTKGREERPAFDALCKDAARRKFNMVAAWSVDRLSRSSTI